MQKNPCYKIRTQATKTSALSQKPWIPTSALYQLAVWPWISLFLSLHLNPTSLKWKLFCYLPWVRSKIGKCIKELSTLQIRDIFSLQIEYIFLSLNILDGKSSGSGWEEEKSKICSVAESQEAFQGGLSQALTFGSPHPLCHDALALLMEPWKNWGRSKCVSMLNGGSLAIGVLAWGSPISPSQRKERKASSEARGASPFFTRNQESWWGLPRVGKESKVMPHATESLNPHCTLIPI